MPLYIHIGISVGSCILGYIGLRLFGVDQQDSAIAMAAVFGSFVAFDVARHIRRA